VRSGRGVTEQRVFLHYGGIRGKIRDGDILLFRGKSWISRLICRVTGSPEELIIDFGLNPQPVGMPKNPIQVTQRCIVNYYTAKRLLHALSLSVQRHEAVFGVLETDIQKRVKPLNR